MTPEDARKLLGGYATGTLTEAEEQALFAAALEDQSLFDELAREQGLRDLLRDPAAKGRLLAALDEPRRARWRSWKPAAVLAMAGLAAVAVVVGTRKAPAPVDLVAKLEMPAAAPGPGIPTVAPVVETVAELPKARKSAAKRTDVSAPPAPKPEMEAAPEPEPVLKAEAPRVTVPVGSAGQANAPAPPPAEQRREVAFGSQQVQVVGPAPSAQQSFAPSDTRLQVQELADAQMQKPSARLMFLGGAPPARARVQSAAIAARTGGPQVVGLRYTIERREGEEAVAIRFTANVNGYLSVAGAAPVALTARQPYTTAPLTADEVKVVFSRQPETSVALAVVPVTEVTGGDTYVVNPTGAPLSFTIPLKQQ